MSRLTKLVYLFFLELKFIFCSDRPVWKECTFQSIGFKQSAGGGQDTLFSLILTIQNLVSISALTQWESTGEPLTMETIKNFFDFFHRHHGCQDTVLCNVYGGTEMMDNVCEVFGDWESAVVNFFRSHQLGMVDNF